MTVSSIKPHFPIAAALGNFPPADASLGKKDTGPETQDNRLPFESGDFEGWSDRSGYTGVTQRNCLTRLLVIVKSALNP
jgi:hypothetical protein